MYKLKLVHGSSDSQKRIHLHEIGFQIDITYNVQASDLFEYNLSREYFFLEWRSPLRWYRLRLAELHPEGIKMTTYFYKRSLLWPGSKREILVQLMSSSAGSKKILICA